MNSRKDEQSNKADQKITKEQISDLSKEGTIDQAIEQKKRNSAAEE
ncbi:hypothetical protein [Aureibacillus halotolerans]|uniref:Uncharacterized protein n=1 Tax=Aureibacillus halotolerans TaxID=1508390 RepID=A0A4R6TV25_9BACI|nr:hypothetical protein [Aureibacillus halotolerans]TDQ36083.1 hypothetical protein EV213_12014 [Aureibacillus halotolerans]